MRNLRGLAWETADIVAAVPKGHLASSSLDALDQLGYDTGEVRANERRQLFPDARIMTMRPSDVVKYVEAGAADVGIVGKDVIVEYSGEAAVYELLDLGFGQCRMVLATVAGGEDPVETALRRLGAARIATKFPRTALSWSERCARPIELVELKGSIELAAIAGLADGIVDLVDTGTTLRENGLVVRDTIAESTARLICNPVAYSRKAAKITNLLDRLTAESRPAEKDV